MVFFKKHFGIDPRSYQPAKLVKKNTIKSINDFIPDDAVDSEISEDDGVVPF